MIKFDDIFTSKAFKITAVALGAVIYGLIIFKCGMVAGFRQADFSHRLSEQYGDIFTNGPPGLRQQVGDRAFPNANGAAGKIIKISEPYIYVAEPNDGEKVVSTDQSTVIRMFREQIPFSKLTTDEFVVVVGEPEDGKINAKLIRVVPAPSAQPIVKPAPTK